jgi:hypothetical protein
MPVSMIVVHSSRLARWPVKSRITRSSSRSFIWPWPMTIRASGTSFSSLSRMLAMVSTSLCRKYTWPPRFSSRSTASRMMPSEKLLTKVLIARRFCGAVAITEKSRRPSIDIAKRARDRCRGQRQDVDLGAHRLQRLLLAHAEAVFLVDDDQPQLLEADVLADQLVRADDDIDPAFGEFPQGLRRFLGRLEARDFGDPDRPVGEAVGEGLVMLFAEQRRRAQHGHLLAAGDGAERGAQGDLGLAEANVAADQAVHRLAGAHVVDDGGDGRRLVGGFLETETVGKGLVIVLGKGEGMALAGGAGGVESQQFGGGVARLLGRLALGLFPLAGAERMQRRGFRVGAGIARNDLQLRHRHEQLGLVGVMQFEEFLLAECRGPCAPAPGSGRCRGFHGRPGRRP